MQRMRCIVLTIIVSVWGAEVRADAKLQLHRGDHVCLIGNTFAERMQHHGWFETLLHARFPEHKLVVRNLGFSGDELALRLRSLGFGTPDEHLAFNKADVVLAFFGYNESHAGQAGLEQFRKDLDVFVKHTLAQRYNGKSAPRLALISPIAHEDLEDPDLPDGIENNVRIGQYTQAMSEVAAKNRVAFIDIFSVSRDLFTRTQKPLTINGIHLNESGDRLLAPVLADALFGATTSGLPGAATLERIRAAVNDKNLYWFHRYRTVDGYSIFGGRADLKFVDGQTNREVMQRELLVLDTMTSNRDRRVWEVAQGRDLQVTDINTPAFIPVKTNKPGSGPNGEHHFLPGEEAIAGMTIHEQMAVNLFASEEMFPELAKPVQMAFDTKGRLWVAVMPSYPHWKPKDPLDDKVLIFEDNNGDGRADMCKVFADKLHVPTGLEFFNGGLLVGQQPDLMYLKDTDGDDVADVRERVLHGIDSADTHHALNSFTLDPGGALYFQEGTFHHSQVETPYGPPVRLANAGVFRFEPRTRKFEVYVTYPFANPHGHVFDRWGQDLVTDGTGNVNYFASAFSGRLDFPRKHAPLEPIFKQKTRPCPGTEILSSRHFPDALQGNYLVGNVIGFQGILQYRLSDDGAGLAGVELDPIVQSSDPNFRPADIEIGPDGAIYFLDWQNPIIGHMQHNLRDPSRDAKHGRIYRVTWKGRPLSSPARIAGATIDELLDLLKSPENRVRYRAKIELGARRSDEVIAATARWIERLNQADPDGEHHLLEALWVHQYHNQVNEALLRRILRSGDFRARAAATRVLCYWRDRVSDPLGLLAIQAKDVHPRVRLEAVRACSFFREPRAAEVALLIVDKEMDRYLAYTLGETMVQLEPYWKRAITDARPFSAGNPAGVAYLLRNVDTSELIKLPRTPMVYHALLARHPVSHDHRVEAIAGLATQNRSDHASEIIAAIGRLDRTELEHAEHVLHDLGRLLLTLYRPDLDDRHSHNSQVHAHGAENTVRLSASVAELRSARDRIAKLASAAERPLTRQIAFVVLMTADNSLDPTWGQATRTSRSLLDVLESVPLLPDARLRSAAHERILPLLTGIPEDLKSQLSQFKGVVGRYVRIELPRRGTLTLAEVQVMSDGSNIAAAGTARQSSTSRAGDAKNAIDGNTSGRFADGGQSHTIENEDQPWWELDLGLERPMDAIVVWNRSENKGLFAKRLDGFNLTVFDIHRRAVAQKLHIAAPEEFVRVALSGDFAEAVRQAAIKAIVTTGRNEEGTFITLARFIQSGTSQAAAVRSIARIPNSRWSHAEIRPTLDAIISHVQRLPARERTLSDTRKLLQLGNDLAALLPARQAQQIRRTLRDLGVPVIVIRPIPHLMLFDRKEFFVEAGRPIEIVLENTDLMPHNLIVARPGSLEKVGIAAEKMAGDPAAFDKHFIPNLPDVLFATRMLQPRQEERLNFTAPANPGDYPFVCTFPGHWRRMFGIMHVVRSLDDVPSDVLAAAHAPTQTASRPFVRAWKVDELAGTLRQNPSGRDLARGKQLFTAIACVQCHKIKGEGGQVGPDLVSVKEKLSGGKMTELDVLTEMLEPSKVIDEKFRTNVFELSSGQLVSGIVVEEKQNEVVVRTNPLDNQNEKPRLIPKDQISERIASKFSLMPDGLLNTLTQDEILDLLGYVVSGG